MRLSEVIDRVRIADILGTLVELRCFGGGKWRGVCPIHPGAENMASFSVNEEIGFAHCFSCGGTWNKVELAAELYGLTKKEAAHYLAMLAGTTLDGPGEEDSLSAEQRREAHTEGERVAAWRKIRYLRLWRRRGAIERRLKEINAMARVLLGLPPTLREHPQMTQISEECFLLDQQLIGIEEEQATLRTPNWPTLIDRYRAICKHGAPKTGSAAEMSFAAYLLNGGELTPQILGQMEREGIHAAALITSRQRPGAQ